MCSFDGLECQTQPRLLQTTVPAFNPISIPQETMSGLVDPEETVPVALSPYDKEKITIVRTPPPPPSPRCQTLNQPAS